MAAAIVRRQQFLPLFLLRYMTTSAAHVAARHIDHTFEKLMDVYKHYLRVVSIQDLILASPDHSVTLPFLSSLSQKLHLNRGAPYFLRKYPHIFSLQYDPVNHVALVRLTPAAADIARLESKAISTGIDTSVNRLVRILCMSPTRTVPLRAVFKVWKELGLPDDFEQSILARNPRIFGIRDNPKERNTHLLQLLDSTSTPDFTPAIEKWRINEMDNKVSKSKLDDFELKFGFKQRFPPGMKLKKNFRKKVKDWQRLPYLGPYEKLNIAGDRGKRAREEIAAMEKRSVGIVHEFLSLTVEKMVEVEQISQFRKWFGVDLNVRDLFVDHPGIFYLSTKGKRHTVFLREAYDRGRLIEPNPVYEIRRKLLHLVMLGRRAMVVASDADNKGHVLDAQDHDDDDDDDDVEEEEDELEDEINSGL